MENTADVEYYTTYPKTPGKKGGKPQLPVNRAGNPVAHARTPSVTSGSPVMRNDTFCTTTIVQNVGGK